MAAASALGVRSAASVSSACVHSLLLIDFSWREQQPRDARGNSGFAISTIGIATLHSVGDAQHLPPDLRATVVTHSVPAMAALAQHPTVEVVLLGGTDLFLAFQDRNAGFPVLDCADVHVEAIYQASLRTT